MAKFLAPGVKRIEVDESEIVTPAGTSVGAMVGDVQQGPTNRRIRVTNDKEFLNTFGSPVSGIDATNIEEVSLYAGKEFLQESNSLFYVRTSDTGSHYSNIMVSTAVSGQPVSSVTIDEGTTTALLAREGYADGNKADSIYAIDNATISSAGYATIFSAIGPGAYGDNVGVSVITCASTSGQGLFDWGYSYDDPESDGTMSSAADAKWPQVYKVNVYTKPDGTDESWFVGQDGISGTPDESFLVSNVSTLKDSAGSSLYAPNVINGNSELIYIKTNSSYPADTSAVEALYGGANAAYSNSEILTGWDLFAAKEKSQVNILISPDIPKSTAQIATIKKAGNIASSRQDCMSVGQVGTVTGSNVSTIVDSELKQFSFNNPSYTALYAGYTTVYDSYTDKEINLPNAIFAPGIFARTDRVAQTWSAPAGVNRGIIGSALTQNVVYNEAEVGYLYDNNINPIMYKRGYGYVIWGQKTAQRKKSALDRINVRRLLLYVENSIEPTLVPFLFEANTEKVRDRMTSIVENFMQTVKSGQGVYAFNVVCDETNNTPQIIDQNQLNLDLYVQPTKTAEFIQFKTIVTKTGVSVTS